MLTLEEIQARALRVAGALAQCRTVLGELVAELYRHHVPQIRGPEWEAMAEDDVAPSVPYYLAGLLDVLESDTLQAAEDDLRRAATITAEELAREWRETHDQAEDVDA